MYRRHPKGYKNIGLLLLPHYSDKSRLNRSSDDASPESSNASLLHFDLEFELNFSLRELRYMTITTVDSNVDHCYFV